MRLEPGTHRYVSTSGVEINVDKELTQSQVDLVVEVIARAGQSAASTWCVELLGEAGAFIEYVKPNDPVIYRERVA